MTHTAIPQSDPRDIQAERARGLAWSQTLYTWAHSHTYEHVDGETLTLEPIAVLNVDAEHPFPTSQNLNAIQFFDISTTLIDLIGLIITNLADLADVGAVRLDDPPPDSFEPAPASGADRHTGLRGELGGKIAGLVEHVAHDVENVVHDVEYAVHDVERVAHDVALGYDALKDLVGRLSGLRQEITQLFQSIDRMFAQSHPLPPNVSADLGQLLNKLSGRLINLLYGSEVFAPVLERAGLRGKASSIEAYGNQFQTIVVPNVEGDSMTDATFARMRIAGPNPLLLTRVRSALPDNFPVSPRRFKELTGYGLDEAIASGRAYLVDYAPLAALVAGEGFAGQKYTCAPLALFALSEDREVLSPVAIQLGQNSDDQTPVFYPDQGTAWEIAKIHVQSADGNYHELISHLGLTHLLIEPFAVATHRNLAQRHPVFLLLLPHFQGTLFINWSALVSLIAPGGAVDSLLAGTIESDWRVTTHAVKTVNFNDHLLPKNLKDRGVDDLALLPGYPYRDDATLLWKAIETWVGDYLHIYYKTDADVVGDWELQSWFRDLVSSKGGCVNGLGELGEGGERGLFTIAYLTRVLTMVIFTSSVQHATVNFPQLYVMSYAPAMPLATYAPPPTRLDPDLPPEAVLDHLPPLEMANYQLLLGHLLGNVYFTRLGQYDRHQRSSPWFKDPRVNAPLEQFQRNLVEIEAAIAKRNLQRPLYETLLPSRIPQSINI